jgi:hypothetical protein
MSGKNSGFKGEYFPKLQDSVLYERSCGNTQIDHGNRQLFQRGARRLLTRNAESEINS